MYSSSSYILEGVVSVVRKVIVVAVLDFSSSKDCIKLMLLIVISKVLFVIVLDCVLYSATWNWYGFGIGLHYHKFTTADVFYPQEKQEKNAYILIIKNILFDF